MARTNSKSTGSNGVLKFAGAAAAAIVGGIAIGYLFGGAHPKPVESVAPPPTPTVSPLAPPVSPSAIHPHATNADYTAPGAPRIAIHEESAPVMRRVPPPATPADPEASQEAAPPVPPAKPHKPAAPATSDNGSVAPSDTSAPPVTTDPGDGTTPSAPAPGDNTPASPPATSPAPADPDFERVNKPPDPQSGQADGNKAQFRVQTGAYTDESNARSVADQLRGEGFTTSTRSEQQGDRLVYKVQVGAYRSKNGAAKAVADLQKKGYTAFVSPIAP